MTSDGSDKGTPPAGRRAMELIEALAKVYEADRLVDVQSVQVSGVSYHNLGDAGLLFLEDWAETGTVQVPTATLNPAGMDLERWTVMGIDPVFAEKQLRVIRAYEKMGIAITCTCTPYLAGNVPGQGDHVAWAESSAVTYANSVLGAKTNREGGPAALAAALTGKTVRWGLHLDENRVPDVGFSVETDLGEPFDWSVLGAFIGIHFPGALPFIVLEAAAGRSRAPSVADLKALSAALPTYGAQPMFHLQDVTPEASAHRMPHKVVRVTGEQLHETAARLNDPSDRVDLVCLGCPHATFQELVEVDRLLAGRRVTAELWLCTSRPVRDQARQAGIVERVEACGARVLTDTCFVVAPIAGRFATVATDSAKGCYYSRGHNKTAVRTGPTGRCIEAAVTGTFR